MIFLSSPVLWLLAVLAFVALVTFFERWIEFRRAQIDYQDFLRGVINVLDSGNDAEALAVCDDTAAPVANVVAAAIRHRSGGGLVLRDAVDSQGRAEVGRLDRRLASLAIIGQVSPLIGLLGTIVGFVRTILLVNGQAIVSRAELLNDAMVALIETGAGLFVAIVAIVMYGSLRVRLDRIVVEMEAAATQIVGYISSVKQAQRVPASKETAP